MFASHKIAIYQNRLRPLMMKHLTQVSGQILTIGPPRPPQHDLQAAMDFMGSPLPTK